MACYQIPHHQLHAFWRMSYCCGRSLSVNQKLGYKFTTIRYPRRTYSSRVLFEKDSCKVQPSLSSGFCKVLQPCSRGVVTSAQNVTLSQSTVSDSTMREDGSTALNPSNGRVMLIDGTSIMYRAYYKLIAKLHHGHLSHADGNGDWVLTIFSALSLLIADAPKMIFSDRMLCLDN